MDHVLGWLSEKSGCGVSFETVRIIDLDFADDAETNEVLSCGAALELVSEEAEPIGLRVSWIKTKVQAFGDILDATIEPIPVRGEIVKVTQSTTYTLQRDSLVYHLRTKSQ